MQTGTPKTTEQEVCEVFGWSEPNIFVRIVVQAIERIQTCYETHPVGGQPTEAPLSKAETAAQLKMELALLRQLKEAMQICAFARKAWTYAQKQGQAGSHPSAEKQREGGKATFSEFGTPLERGTTQRTAPATPFASLLKQMLPAGANAQKTTD